MVIIARGDWQPEIEQKDEVSVTPPYKHLTKI